MLVATMAATSLQSYVHFEHALVIHEHNRMRPENKLAAPLLRRTYVRVHVQTIDDDCPAVQAPACSTVAVSPIESGNAWWA